MISVLQVLNLLEAGKTTAEAAEEIGCSKSSIIRIATGTGYEFPQAVRDWKTVDEMLLNGDSPADIAEATGCAQSSITRRRAVVLKIKRRYMLRSKTVGYAAQLEETLREIHKKHFPGTKYEDFRAWCRTPKGTDFIMNLQAQEHYTQQRDGEGSLERRPGRHGAHA